MPGWIRRFVEALCPPDRCEEVLGDLEEVHLRRRRHMSSLRAGAATLWDAAGITAHLLRVRAARGVERGALTASEFRLALRLLRRSPVVSATVVLALTCGVALATTGFTVVRAVLDVELPFPEGARVVAIELRDARTAEPREAPAPFLDALDGPVSSLERWGGSTLRSGNLRLASDEILLVDVLALTPGGFDYALPAPVLGRSLPRTAPEPGEPRPALVSRSLWEQRLGGEDRVLGTTVEVSGEAYRVVGVMPADAGFPARADIWTLLHTDGVPRADLTLWGLLAPGTSPRVAAAELGALAGGAARAAGVPPVQVRIRRAEDPPRSGSQGVLVVGFLLAFLLVIAGNVGNLMVARASARTEELTIRAALGADRFRLVVQLALEAATLVTVATAAGLWISGRLLAWFRTADAEQLPPWIELAPGGWTVAFVVLTAVLLTVVAGVLPAFRATRGTAPGLRAGSRGSTGGGFGWAHSTMIVAQIAFSTGILGAAVLVHRAWSSAFDLDRVPLADAITTAWVSLPDGEGEGEARSGREEQGRILSDLVSAVRTAHPEASVGLSTYLPGVDAPLGRVEVEEGGESLRVPFARVSPAFYQVVGAEALSGRLPAQGGVLPEAVVDRPFVERHLGSANAVGRRIRLVGSDGTLGNWHRIVAVVPDLGLAGMDADAAGGVYLPFTGGSTARLLVRDTGDPAALGRTLPGIAYGVHPDVAVSRIHTLGGVVRGVRSIFQGLGAVFTGLGVLVLVLALMGVYAILSFEVARRRREIGIRVALGASAGDVVRPLLVRVALYVTLGGGLGWLLGAGVVSTARAMIQLRLAPGGAGIFAALSVLVLATAAAAALTPALRALRIQPGEALQAE